MTAVLELADRGLLAALAIAYDKAGMRERPLKLVHAGAHVGRDLASTSELTADEARALRRHVPRCGADCPALATTSSTEPATCACAAGGRPGQPSPCDPRGLGRWCPPAICWCGTCPWWQPAPVPNYAAALASLTPARGGRW